MKSSPKAPAGRWLIAVAFILAGCGAPEQSPEARIKALIAEAEAAAEARDVSALKDLVSGAYRDRRGYDRQTVLRVAQGLFIRNQKIYLLTIIRNLETEGESASARILAAMAGRPIESVQSLVNIRAELMRFDVELAREDGHWRVRSADWRRAEVNDFL
jgi:hypothetical protein